ncbi:hypothetical protein HD806DRAFT_144859 [Xylariaceae sp. AK1471]|nr:hypothetical protein HD806DRAFT_144859 [Xylariaceae sp. AK1471]
MDDPWGSPWASTDTPSDNDPPSSRANTFLSPPPKAFFGNATSLSTQSPWSGNNDDDGLGIWTTADRVDSTDNQNEWGTWAESGVQPPRLSPRLSVSGKDSPLAWPENAAASPILIANSRSRTPSIFRHHSPDPWATELSLTNKSDIEPPIPLKATASDTPTIEAAPVKHAIVGGTEGNASNEESSVEGGFTSEAAIRESSITRTNRDLAEGQVNTSSNPNIAVYELPSRPSSTFSLNSHDGPERQDSPITSIDEDRGARIQDTLRKSSGKVQELVGIFDGLARAASDEPPTLDRLGISKTRSREESLERNENKEDDGVGFGDFEDAIVNDQRVPRSPDEASSSSKLSSTPKAEHRDGFAQEHRNEGGEGRTIVIETTPVPIQNHANKFGNLYFDTNLVLANKLFPDLPEFLGSRSTEDWEVPDHIISDTFTTISERKAWYRISRYGSMRKHNSGDDENYHRVAWRASQLHSDTIKIVRRWMEQDSYAGRATLGGTKRTGFFDWDSNAAPVGLDKVFRRKKSTTEHTRTASIPAPANNAALQTTSVDKRSYRNSTGISLAAEGQSASHSISPIASSNCNSEAKQVAPTNRLSSLSSQGAKVLERTGYAAPTPVPTPRPAPVQTTFANEDDDDWGEMVSSPRVDETDIQTNISAFPLAAAPSENHRPTSRLSLAISDVARPAQSKQLGLPNAQPIMSDSWSLTDISVFDKPTKAPKSPTVHTSQPSADFSVFEPATSLPNADSLEPLKQKSNIRCGTSNENMIPGRAAVDETLPASVPSKGTPAVHKLANVPRNESQDNLIVQSILQNLPDLSYMLR